MPQFRSCLVTLVVVALFAFAYGSAIRPHNQPAERAAQSDSKPDQSRFEQLLGQVSDASLHRVLHKYVTYKHGVFSEDRKAVQAIHDSNPAIGTSLVELARRQNGNATTTTPPPTTDQQSTTSSTRLDSSTTPPPVTTSTTTPPPGTTTTTPSTSTTTPGGQQTTTTPGQTTSSGQTSRQTTSAPPPGTTTGQLRSEQVIYTTTLPNGARSTVTYITIVPANQQVSTPGVTATGSPSLQNGAERGGIGGGIGLGAGILALMMAL